MSIGIYTIISPTSKVYVGQSWDISRRWRSYNRLSCSDQPAIYNSLKKHGPEAHDFETILDFTQDVTQAELDWWEQIMMDYHREKGDELLFIRDAGSNGKQAEETKRKLSESKKDKKRKPFTAEHQQKLKDRWTYQPHPWEGRNHSGESRQKMSNSHKGKNTGNKNPMFGKTHSELAKLKISKAWKGKKHRPESILKIQKATAGENNPMYSKFGIEHGASKTVVQLTKEGKFVKNWDCISDAGRFLQMKSTSNISGCCRGKRKTAAGFKWKYNVSK